MKLKRNISWLFGSAALAGLALGGLITSGPLNRAAASSELLLHSALLILFWIGYVTSMICVLCAVGERIWGRELEPDKRHPAIKD
jgi:hypothetical protein